MAIFTIFVANLPNLYRITLLMYKLLSDRLLLRKYNQMNFESKKLAKSVFYLFYQRHEAKNLKISSRGFWSPFPSWPLATKHIY